ncbi:MAG: hypothetical protein KFW21_00320 [Spirochaetota bacterium]|nr:hypothetical protein [Spirochaetota bacterium]
MSILGVLLLLVILATFSIILLANQIENYLSSYISKQAKTSDLLLKIQEFLLFLQIEIVKKNMAYMALLFAVWNFFGPNFGSIYGGLPLIGALIPATILFLDALILYPQLLDLIPFASFNEKLTPILEKITPIAGWLTLLTTFLHAILYRFPFF